MDSALGRFISPDSIVPDPTAASSYNRFAYVTNNPLRYNDPSGHCKWGLPCPPAVKKALDLAVNVKYTTAVAVDSATKAVASAGRSVSGAQRQVSNRARTAARGAMEAFDFMADLVGEQVSSVETLSYVDGRGEPAEAKVAILNDRSITGRIVAAINGGGGATTVGFGPYDIYSTIELGP